MLGIRKCFACITDGRFKKIPQPVFGLCTIFAIEAIAIPIAVGPLQNAVIGCLTMLVWIKQDTQGRSYTRRIIEHAERIVAHVEARLLEP